MKCDRCNCTKPRLRCTTLCACKDICVWYMYCYMHIISAHFPHTYTVHTKSTLYNKRCGGFTTSLLNLVLNIMTLMIHIHQLFISLIILLNGASVSVVLATGILTCISLISCNHNSENCIYLFIAICPMTHVI